MQRARGPRPVCSGLPLSRSRERRCAALEPIRRQLCCRQRADRRKRILSTIVPRIWDNRGCFESPNAARACLDLRRSSCSLRRSPRPSRRHRRRSASGISRTSRMCRRWSRATSSGRAASGSAARLGPGVKIEWYTYNAGPERHGGDLRQLARPDLCGPESGAQRLCALARRGGPDRRGRRERRLRAGGAAGLGPRQARRFPRQAHRHAAVRQHAGRRRARLARGRRAAHHADRRRRAGAADRQPRPARACSRASSSTRSGPSSPGCRASSSEAGGKVLVEEKDAITTVLASSAEFLAAAARPRAALRRGASRADRVDQAEPGGGAAHRSARNCRRTFRAEMSPELVARAWTRMTHRPADTSLGGVPVASSTSAQQVGLPARRAGPVAPDRGRPDGRATAADARRRAQARRRGRVEVVSHRRAPTVHALDDVVARRSARASSSAWSARAAAASRTLLDIIAGLTQPDAGRVLADGKPVDGPGPRAPGDVPGIGAVSRGSTSFGNVMFGLKLQARTSRKRERREIARSLPRARRARELRARAHPRALRRHEAARRARARARARSAGAADGRAVRRARRA